MAFVEFNGSFVNTKHVAMVTDDKIYMGNSSESISLSGNSFRDTISQQSAVDKLLSADKDLHFAKFDDEGSYAKGKEVFVNPDFVLSIDDTKYDPFYYPHSEMKLAIQSEDNTFICPEQMSPEDIVKTLEDCQHEKQQPQVSKERELPDISSISGNAGVDMEFWR